jgi:protein involved in polysaccharide export with SLBB domain
VYLTDSLGIEISGLEDYIEFGVDIAQLYKTKGTDLKYNVILKDGDVIEIPKADYTIQVIGEVQRPTVINFKKGMTALQAISQAGGATDLAKKRGTFVVYQNGNVSSFKGFLFFNFPPRLEPGSKIIVPKKVANPNKTSLAEIIGLTSTLATLAVLINSL